ncbi:MULTISPECIES: efflux RND transporter periplasmic adaptor subunit [unclassified Saccharicrinis]|uniref:efflux RND transporter periplasmic adaptor subunit n=1 Tax=unclassified Saccharicrinis TaxID=2646859 RepID=UPI003D33CC2D
MRNKKNVNRLIIACLIVTIGIIYFGFIKPAPYSENSIQAEVKRGDFKSLVYSTGQLQAQNSVSINVPNELSARYINIYEIKVTKLIEEGTVVDSGDYVASLDHSAVEEKMSEALVTLTEKLEAYEDAKIDTNINLSNLRDNLITARIDMEEKNLILKQSVYESPSVIRQASLDVDKAKRKLDQELRNYDLKKQQDVIKVNRAYKSIESVRTRIQEIENLFEAIDIKAPAPGMLIYSFDRTGNKIKVGSIVNRWEPKIAELPDLTSMISKTFINEVDISKIKVGQKVKVGVDAFPEKEFDGEVTEVANIGQVIPGGDSKVFEVSIQVHGYDKDLRPAMTTVNIITTNTLNDVLYIPLEAVFKNDSITYVYKADLPNKKQIIECGAENENYAEVKQGLRQGEMVLMNEPVPNTEMGYIGLDIYEYLLQQDSVRSVETQEQALHIKGK